VRGEVGETGSPKSPNLGKSQRGVRALGKGGWGVRLIEEIRAIALKKLASAFVIAGTALLFVTPLVAWYFNGQITAAESAILPIGAVFIVAACLFVPYIWARFGPDPPLQDVDTFHYWAIPYSPGSDLRDLTAFAQTAFEGDTMSAEVVKHAVTTGCAIGVRVTDDAGQNVGFFDVFRLRKSAMSEWLDGTLSEPELKDTDFEPLSNHEGDQKTVELMVGAIYIEKETRRKVPGLAFLLPDAAQSYFWNACAGWDEIRLYSSIFSKEGKGIASLYGFSKAIRMEHRHGAGAKHDVWVYMLRRSDPARVVRGLGGRHNVILQMKYA
jgi:hypothetical protein